MVRIVGGRQWAFLAGVIAAAVAMTSCTNSGSDDDQGTVPPSMGSSAHSGEASEPDSPNRTLSPATESGSQPSSGSPTLLTAQAGSSDSFAAIVGGILAINERGCFTVDDALLVAPHGSSVTDDGLGVSLEGYESTERVGEELSVGGGYEEAPTSELSAEQADCVPEGTDQVTIAVVAPASGP